MASKSGRKRRQLEDRLASAGPEQVSPRTQPAASDTQPPTSVRRVSVEVNPVARAEPVTPTRVIAAESRKRVEASPSAKTELVVSAPRAFDPAVPVAVPAATPPVAPRHALPPLEVVAPWRGKGSVDINIAAPRVLVAASPRATAPSASVWPEQLNAPAVSPVISSAATQAAAPAVRVAPLLVSTPESHGAAPGGDELGVALARIEGRLEALSQWAREFSAWQGRKDAIPAGASAAKNRLVLAMLGIFAPLFALLFWRLCAGA